VDRRQSNNENVDRHYKQGNLQQMLYTTTKWRFNSIFI